MFKDIQNDDGDGGHLAHVSAWYPGALGPPAPDLWRRCARAAARSGPRLRRARRIRTARRVQSGSSWGSLRSTPAIPLEGTPESLMIGIMAKHGTFIILVAIATNARPWGTMTQAPIWMESRSGKDSQ